MASFYKMKESNFYLSSGSSQLHPPAAVKRDVVGLGGKGVVARGLCQTEPVPTDTGKPVIQASSL